MKYFITYIERKGEVTVETGEENKESCDEVIDGSSARVGREPDRDDIDDCDDGAAEILKKNFDKSEPATKLKEAVTDRTQDDGPRVSEGKPCRQTVDRVLVHSIGHV